MCKSAPSRNSRPRNGVNLVDPDYSTEEELLSVAFDTTEGNVHMVHEDSLPEKKIFATMEIAGESVQMQIDKVLHVMFCLRSLCRQEQTLLSPTVL